MPYAVPVESRREASQICVRIALHVAHLLSDRGFARRLKQSFSRYSAGATLEERVSSGGSPRRTCSRQCFAIVGQSSAASGADEFMCERIPAISMPSPRFISSICASLFFSPILAPPPPPQVRGELSEFSGLRGSSNNLQQAERPACALWAARCALQRSSPSWRSPLVSCRLLSSNTRVPWRRVRRA